MNVFDLWAMQPEVLADLVRRWERHAQGDPAVEAARPGERPTASAPGVAVIPVVGPITQRGGGLFEAFFGGTSTERIGAKLSQALSDPGVGSIVLDVDSPGGTVNGVAELADSIYQARGRKPIVAVSNTLMASAAYWIGASADEVIASPSSQTGSIGVYALHVDQSRAWEAAGLTATLISAGKYKTEANEFAPLSDEARAAVQGQVDAYYEMFVNAVARGRGKAAVTVRNGFGEGRVLTAQAAVDAHLADRVGTLGEAVARAGALARRRAAAQADALRLLVA